MEKKNNNLIYIYNKMVLREAFGVFILINNPRLIVDLLCSVIDFTCWGIRTYRRLTYQKELTIEDLEPE